MLEEVVQLGLSGDHMPVLIFQLDIAVARDVLQVTTDYGHPLRASPLVADLDHHFRGMPKRCSQLLTQMQGVSVHCPMR
ncbi:hypothetical protein WI92_27595 [Burkholderia vietnamiensis]|nr:hypothetical protein WI92_27595 [Burkholderia vietnamiensis]